MAILFTDGFDSYGTTTGTNILTRWTSASNPNGAITSTTPFNYGQAHYPGGNSSNATTVSFTSTPTITIGANIYVTDPLAATIAYPLFGLLSSGTWMMGLVAGTDGGMAVSRMTSAAGGTVLVGSNTNIGTIKANTWYYVEFSVTISDTVGTVRVDVDGRTVINQTGLDTRNGTPTTVNTLSLGTNDSAGVYFDDLYISDSITPLGPQRIYTLKPNADTAQKAWTATAGWQPFSGTTSSTSANATKGNIFTCASNITLTGVSFVCVATAQTVRLGIAQLTSITGTVSSVLYDSTPVVRAATAGVQSFTFPAINFTAGNVYAIYLTRTDGTGTAALSINASSVQDLLDPTGSLNYNGYTIIADNNITGGETLFTGSSAGYTMILTYSGLPNYESVFDPDVDGDVSYVTASNVGDYDLYDVANYPAASANIKAVNQIVWAKKTDATTRTMNLTTKSGATTTDSSAVTLSTSYAGYSNIYETDPNTTSAWTVSGVNALQIGQKVAS